MSTCPECGSNFTRRVPRTFIMRCIPGTKRILCTDCGERSLVFGKSKAASNRKPVVRLFSGASIKY